MTAQDSATAQRTKAVGLGAVLASLGVLAFSFSFPATAWALRGFGPWTTTGMRGLLAGVLAAACLTFARAPLPRRNDWPGLFVVAGGCVIGFPLLTTFALRVSTTAHSAVVIGVLPLATAVMAAVWTRRRLPVVFWVAAVAGAAAVVGFTLAQSGGPPTVGYLYLFGALLLCAAGYVEGGRLAAHLPGWQVIAWGVVVAFPVSALVTVVALPFEPVHPTALSLVGVGYIAAVSQMGGFVVWYRGMAEIGVPRASQFQLAQPLVTLVWSVWVMGERVSALAPVTAVVVLACIAVTQRVRR